MNGKTNHCVYNINLHTIKKKYFWGSGILDKALHGSFTRGRRLPWKVEYLRPQVLAPKKAA
ncbi:hypothetical protein NZJ93_11835 [Desulfofundulus thermocisternus]|nr:hypothetical protein [Desulfofundulus thermocisternus]